MNAPDDNDQTLALLRDLPVEVSLEQVAHMVAAFPLAAGTTGWLASIKTNLNTILMITIGTLVIGTAIYFMPASTSEAQTTPEPQVPEVSVPAPVGEAPQTETAQPAEMSALSVADTAHAPAPIQPAALEPVTTPAHAPHAAEVVPPVATSAPMPATSLPQTGANAKIFDLRDFSAVVAYINVDVSVEEGPWSVTANGDPEQMERLEIKVENGALKINVMHDKKILWSRNMGKVNVEVRMPQVTRLELYSSGSIKAGELGAAKNLAVSVMGSGDIDLNGVKALDELTLMVQGSGDINCRSAIVSGRTAVSVMGSGDMKASGTTGSIDVLIQGSGDVDLTGMQAQSGKVSILGSGDAFVNCTSHLERLITGSGTIRNAASAGGTVESDGE